MFEILMSARKNVVTPPGPTKLLVGNSQLGYYGTVSSTDFIGGNALAAALSLTAGTAFNDAVDWFKFAYKGKTLYVPMKPFRYNLSYINISNAQAANGNTTLTIKNKRFIVRLMKGSALNPYTGANNTTDDPKTVGSEFNDLMYRVCETNPPSETAPVFANYTQDQLGYIGNGGQQLCQEAAQPNGGGTGMVVGRGDAAGNFAGVYCPSFGYVDQYRGWRPVLEWVS